MTNLPKSTNTVGLFKAPTNSDLGQCDNPDPTIRDYHVKELAPIVEELLTHHKTNDIVAIGPGMQNFLKLRAAVGLRLRFGSQHNVDEIVAEDEVKVNSLKM